jgi:hypothetical protein
MEHFWYEPACSSTCKYVQVHTAIYWFVLYLMTQECFAKQYLHALVHTKSCTFPKQYLVTSQKEAVAGSMRKSCTCMFWYIPVCTSTYWYIPGIYWYILVCTVFNDTGMLCWTVSGDIIVGGSSRQYEKVLYPWMKLYEAVRGLRTTCYRLVQSYSGVQDFLVLPATASYCDVARYGLAKHSCVIKYSTYQYIPVCTGTYWYVPEHAGSY